MHLNFFKIDGTFKKPELEGTFKKPELEYSFVNNTLQRVNSRYLYEYRNPIQKSNNHSLVCFEKNSL